MTNEYYVCLMEEFTDWSNLKAESKLELIKEYNVTGVKWGIFKFIDDGISILQKMINFTRRPSIVVVCGDGRVFLLTIDSFTEQDKGDKNTLKKYIKSYDNYLSKIPKSEKVRKAEERRYSAITENTILSDGISWLFPSFKRLKFFRIQDKFCHRFRLNVPKLKKKCPLVIYLDGAGSPGHDNVKQMFGVINPWHKLKKSKRNCYFLAPQLSYAEGYNRDEHSEMLWELVQYISESFGNIDLSRIYLVGVSYGGYGVIYESFRHPERYAAVVSAVGWVYDEAPRQINYDRYGQDKYHLPFDDDGIKELAKTPTWLAYSNFELGHNEPLYQRLAQAGADVKFTRCDKHGHGMSNGFLRKQEWDSWMFSKTK